MLHKLYHIIAVLSLDAFMLVLWLAAWATTASRRAAISFIIDSVSEVISEGCDEDYGVFVGNCAGYHAAKEVKWRGDASAALAGVGALEW